MTVKPGQQPWPCLGSLSPDYDRRRVFPDSATTLSRPVTRSQRC
jgi:hypothetical protein